MIITVPVVFVLLESPTRAYFLLQRAPGLCNDRFDGVFSLPGGKVEPHETLREAACREALEEVGVAIAQDDLEFVHLGNHFATPTKKIIATIFRARRWSGTASNLELERHTMAAWFTADILPVNLCPFVAAYMQGAVFSENLLALTPLSARGQRVSCATE
jgi:8-oxo-dGTP pyrophosphatase MutT (NUDIX family)